MHCVYVCGYICDVCVCRYLLQISELRYLLRDEFVLLTGTIVLPSNLGEKGDLKHQKLFQTKSVHIKC